MSRVRCAAGYIRRPVDRSPGSASDASREVTALPSHPAVPRTWKGRELRRFALRSGASGRRTRSASDTGLRRSSSGGMGAFTGAMTRMTRRGAEADPPGDRSSPSHRAIPREIELSSRSRTKNVSGSTTWANRTASASDDAARPGRGPRAPPPEDVPAPASRLVASSADLRGAGRRPRGGGCPPDLKPQNILVDPRITSG